MYRASYYKNPRIKQDDNINERDVEGIAIYRALYLRTSVEREIAVVQALSR